MKSLSGQASNATKFFSLQLGQQWLLVRVFFVLSTYKCLLLLFPFNHFVKFINHKALPEKDLSLEGINSIVWAIQVLSNRLPLGFTCLIQALTAKWLLKSHPDVRVYIGVHKSSQQVFSAHAWVMYKDKTIIGEQPNQAFKPILNWN